MNSNFKIKWTKSNDRIIAGVLGGIAEQFGFNKGLTRLIGAFAMIASHGILVLAYILMAYLMPSKPRDGFGSFFSSFFNASQSSTGTNSKRQRKEIKDAEEHDVNE